MNERAKPVCNGIDHNTLNLAEFILLDEAPAVRARAAELAAALEHAVEDWVAMANAEAAAGAEVGNEQQ